MGSGLADNGVGMTPSAPVRLPRGRRADGVKRTGVLGSVAAAVALGLTLVAPSGIDAQRTDAEILSKADAVQLFGMSRAQWDQNVLAVVRTGAATAMPASSTGMMGMTIRTPEGMVGT